MEWAYGPHTWKWAVPCGMAILLGYGAWNANDASVAALMVAFGGLALAVAMTNWWKLMTSHRADLFEQRQMALSMTPLVLLAQNMKQMHPEAVKVLNKFGVQTTWQVKVDASRGTRDWLLLGTNVHFGFIEFVLSRSTKSLYPKFKFGDGSRKWDPDGLVEDRTQYEEFEKWMFARMMVTRSHGEFKPAEFIPPWTPELIMEEMGLTGEQDLFRPDEDVSPVVGPAAGGAMAEFMDDKLQGLSQTASMRAASSK